MRSSNTIEIMGGLGNQLFQIFALMAYSLRNKTPFYFSAQAITQGVRKKTYWDTLFLQNLAPLVKPSPQSHSHHIYREPAFHYQPIPNTEQSLKLFGYFQSYKYFADQEETIYRFIRLRETQAKYATLTAPKIAYDKTIAMHFRVGDYAQLPNHHPLMTLEYYTQALTQFLKDQAEAASTASTQSTANARASALCETIEQACETIEHTVGEHTAGQKRTWNILYFCEEPDQAYVERQLLTPLKANPLFKDNFTFQCIDHQLADWEQVIVMSLCRHHIIANSTFSWWGAYLGLGMRSEGGTPTPSLVYYPRTWFGPGMGPKNMEDLFPPHWHQINV